MEAMLNYDKTNTWVPLCTLMMYKYTREWSVDGQEAI